jgi:hypothetical protein
MFLGLVVPWVQLVEGCLFGVALPIVLYPSVLILYDLIILKLSITENYMN